jgi:hypothetical protein
VHDRPYGAGVGVVDDVSMALTSAPLSESAHSWPNLHGMCKSIPFGFVQFRGSAGRAWSQELRKEERFRSDANSVAVCFNETLRTANHG